MMPLVPSKLAECKVPSGVNVQISRLHLCPPPDAAQAAAAYHVPASPSTLQQRPGLQISGALAADLQSLHIRLPQGSWRVGLTLSLLVLDLLSLFTGEVPAKTESAYHFLQAEFHVCDTRMRERVTACRVDALCKLTIELVEAPVVRLHQGALTILTQPNLR